MKFNFLNQNNNHSHTNHYYSDSYSLDKIRNLRQEVLVIESQIRYLENTKQNIDDFTSKFTCHNMNSASYDYCLRRTVKNVITDVYYSLFLILDPKLFDMFLSFFSKLNETRKRSIELERKKSQLENQIKSEKQKLRIE